MKRLVSLLMVVVMVCSLMQTVALAEVVGSLANDVTSWSMNFTTWPTPKGDVVGKSDYYFIPYSGSDSGRWQPVAASGLTNGNKSKIDIYQDSAADAENKKGSDNMYATMSNSIGGVMVESPVFQIPINIKNVANDEKITFSFDLYNHDLTYNKSVVLSNRWDVVKHSKERNDKPYSMKELVTLGTDGKIHFNHEDKSDTSVPARYSMRYDTGKWYKFKVEYDYGDSKAYYYVDNELVYSETDTFYSSGTDTLDVFEYDMFNFTIESEDNTGTKSVMSFDDITVEITKSERTGGTEEPDEPIVPDEHNFLENFTTATEASPMGQFTNNSNADNAKWTKYDVATGVFGKKADDISLKLTGENLITEANPSRSYFQTKAYDNRDTTALATGDKIKISFSKAFSEFNCANNRIRFGNTDIAIIFRNNVRIGGTEYSYPFAPDRWYNIDIIGVQKEAALELSMYINGEHIGDGSLEFNAGTNLTAIRFTIDTPEYDNIGTEDSPQYKCKPIELYYDDIYINTYKSGDEKDYTAANTTAFAADENGKVFPENAETVADFYTANNTVADMVVYDNGAALDATSAEPLMGKVIVLNESTARPIFIYAVVPFELGDIAVVNSSGEPVTGSLSGSGTFTVTLPAEINKAGNPVCLIAAVYSDNTLVNVKAKDVNYNNGNIEVKLTVFAEDTVLKIFIFDNMDNLKPLDLPLVLSRQINN